LHLQVVFDTLGRRSGMNGTVVIAIRSLAENWWAVAPRGVVSIVFGIVTLALPALTLAEAQIESWSELLAKDPVGARQEIQKHVEDLQVAPAPDIGDRVVRITGRPKLDGLLGGEEAVRLQIQPPRQPR